MDKKPYTSPRMIQFRPNLVPESMVGSFQKELVVTESSRLRVAPVYSTLVDNDRKYVWVSDSFCELLGYKSEELIGMRYDDFTAPTTNDIPLTSSMFKTLGYMHGLWMLVSPHRRADFDSL